MKLFKSLLIAPATLGLLAPMSANATEVNLNEISNYSDIETVEFEDSFSFFIAFRAVLCCNLFLSLAVSVCLILFIADL